MDRQQLSREKCSEWLADDGDDSSVPSRVQQNLRRLLEEHHHHGIATVKLHEVYEAKFGYDLDHVDYGFFSLSKFIDSLPRIFRRVVSKTGYEKLYGAHLEPTALENKFKISGDPVDFLPQDIMHNINAILESRERILMRDFVDIYKTKFGFFIDPTEYGYSNVEELLCQLDGKLLLVSQTSKELFVQCLYQEVKAELEEIPCELFTLQKNTSRDDYPEGALTPHDHLLYAQWENEIKIGETVPVIVTQITQDPRAPLMSIQLFKYRQALDDLNSAMTEFYADCSNEWILPSNVAVSGMFCAAPFMTEGYNRVQIIRRAYDGYIHVYHVDYGNKLKMKKEKLRYLKTEFATLPMLLTEGFLEHSIDYSWYQESYKALRNLVYYGHIEDLQATFVENNTYLQPKGGHLFQFKLKRNGKDVMETLVENNVIKRKTFEALPEHDEKMSQSSNDFPEAESDDLAVPPRLPASNMHEATCKAEDEPLPFPEVDLPGVPFETFSPATTHASQFSVQTGLPQEYNMYQTMLMPEANLGMFPPFIQPHLFPDIGFGNDLNNYPLAGQFVGLPINSLPNNAAWNFPCYPPPFGQPTGYATVPAVPPGFSPRPPPFHISLVPEVSSVDLTVQNSSLNPNVSEFQPKFRPSSRSSTPAIRSLSPKKGDLQSIDHKSVDVLKKNFASSTIDVVNDKEDIMQIISNPNEKTLETRISACPKAPIMNRTSSCTDTLLRRPGASIQPDWNKNEDIVEISVTGRKLHKFMLGGKPFFAMREVLLAFPECVIVESDEDHFEILVLAQDELPNHIMKELISKNIAQNDDYLVVFISVHEFPRFFYAATGNKSDLFAITVNEMMKH